MRLHILCDERWFEEDLDHLQRWFPETRPGVGAFESMRIYERRIPFWPDHFQRLCHGAAHHRLPDLGEASVWRNRLVQVIERNGLRQGRIRLTVWSADGGLHYAIVGQPLPSQPRSVSALRLSPVTWSVCRTPTSAIKDNAYQRFRHAHREALARGWDEALIVNAGGCLVECAMSNVFIVRDQQVFTPSGVYGGLPGVTRKQVMLAARRLGLVCLATRLTRHDLTGADEVFVTNSVIELKPVAMVEGLTADLPGPGSITRRLQEAYRHALEASLQRF
jgi:branched-subunit amino acid aminotransferase/4-amino-4-deoxychorismate lyase